MKRLILQVRQALSALQGLPQQQGATQGFADAPAEEAQTGDGLKHFLDAPKEALLETERAFLTKALEFLKVAFESYSQMQHSGGPHA